MKTIFGILLTTVTLLASPSLFAGNCSGGDHDHGEKYEKDHASVDPDDAKEGGGY